MVFRAGEIVLGLATLVLMPTAVLAQGSPVPGQSSYSASPNSYFQPSSYAQAPVPGAAASPYSAQGGGGGGVAAAKVPVAGKSSYSKLPLNIDDASVRIKDLRNLLSVSRPQDVQESVFQLCEWLSDMADAHWKLSLALSKNDSMKAAAAQERQSAVKFSSLKHEAGLLKAELFIRQNRLPEALGPLVDIVVAEPKSLIGQAAYEKLKEIGFAEEAAESAYQPADRTCEKPQAAAPSAPQFKPAPGQMKVVSPQLKPAPVAAVPKTARTSQATKTR
ncbi:MAG: hypothetical protein IT342_09485 [Candidatus Melainabacteria bacterium]|nr:hypothetical protein [Candidatus Melainabacteria bacterium]